MCDVSDLDARNVLKQVNDDPSVWWAVARIDSSAGKPVARLAASGDAPLAQMEADVLKDDEVCAGLIKVLGVDKRGPVVSTRGKLVFFLWVGSSVPRIKRATVLPVKAALLSWAQGHHLSLELFERGTLSEADIEKRLRAAGGAHQPSDMEFPHGQGINWATGGAAAPMPATSPVKAPTPAAVASPAPPAAAPSPARSTASSASSEHGGPGARPAKPPVAPAAAAPSSAVADGAKKAVDAALAIAKELAIDGGDEKVAALVAALEDAAAQLTVAA